MELFLHDIGATREFIRWWTVAGIIYSLIWPTFKTKRAKIIATAIAGPGCWLLLLCGVFYDILYPHSSGKNKGS